MAEPVHETDNPFGEIAKERLDQSLLSFNEVPKWLAWLTDPVSPSSRTFAVKWWKGYPFKLSER